MRFKLDENIGRRGLEALRAAGHDAETVRDEGLCGAADETLYRVCIDERRILITLDRDFGQVLRFPPEHSAGIIVLDISPRTTRDSILARIKDVLALLDTRDVAGSLWIVEAGRVRIHLTSGDR